jgi:hypothetical protein
VLELGCQLVGPAERFQVVRQVRVSLCVVEKGSAARCAA